VALGFSNDGHCTRVTRSVSKRLPASHPLGSRKSERRRSVGILLAKSRGETVGQRVSARTPLAREDTRGVTTHAAAADSRTSKYGDREKERKKNFFCFPANERVKTSRR